MISPTDRAHGEDRAGQLVDHFRHRVVQEAVAAGAARYWERRAATFEWARPRPGDYLGTAGPQRAAEIDAALVAARDECLHRAALHRHDSQQVT